ncbi:hypothetical protein [Bacillus cereus]|uniref:Uncharacterized protein n=1 Tax=Bacillus cereus TaxID=1396 RepID=A0A164LCM7_BACCE|nr:hypothetical protein [Bacillus cereus]KZD55671.1 hypothetical protein B4088_5416 [Bacillus cereus]
MMIKDFFVKYYLEIVVTFIVVCIILGGILWWKLSNRYDILFGIVGFILWFFFGTKSEKKPEDENSLQTKEDEKNRTEKD